MGFLGTILFFIFVYSWLWFTTRLKTKKHNIIRIIISFSLVALNFYGVIISLESEFIIELLFPLFFLFVFIIRLITDIIFVSKGKFETEETKLKQKINKSFHIIEVPEEQQFEFDVKNNSKQTFSRKNEKNKKKNDFLN